jgi:hypothetical protein
MPSVEDVFAGDLWFFPTGPPHSPQGLGPDGAEFVARSLGTESVGLVFAARVRTTELAGLPELTLGGLPDADARALLGSALTAPLDGRVREQIIAEAHGNPLALLELPRGLTAAELAGGFGLPGTVPRPENTEENFRRRFEALPADARILGGQPARDKPEDPRRGPVQPLLVVHHAQH